MLIFPMIELMGGKPVSLRSGRLEEPHIWHVDPVAKARDFAGAGAEWLHVTDFDAVAGGAPQDDLLREIILAAGIPVQFGGGVRTRERIDALIDMGVGRVVLGSAALTNPELVKEAALHYPDQIVLAVDVFEGQVMADGWRSKSAFSPVDFLTAFQDDPLAAIIVSDIDSDISEADASLALVTEIAAASRHPVIARGLSRSLDALSQLKFVPHVSGAVIGRALFDKSVDLAEALAMAAVPKGPRAEFL